MAKLATLAAILGVLLVMSHAVSANRATITTVDIDEPENQRRHGGGRCEEQLNHCEQLFEDAIRRGRGRQFGGDQYGDRRQFGGDQYGERPYGFGGDQYGERRYGGRGQFGGQDQCSGQQLRQSRHFNQCCQQLRQLEDRCRCEGLREVIREQLGGYGGRESQEDERRCARNLHNTCGLGQSCDARGIW